jgi:hypothetical protein
VRAFSFQVRSTLPFPPPAREQRRRGGAAPSRLVSSRGAGRLSGSRVGPLPLGQVTRAQHAYRPWCTRSRLAPRARTITSWCFASNSPNERMDTLGVHERNWLLRSEDVGMVATSRTAEMTPVVWQCVEWRLSQATKSAPAAGRGRMAFRRGSQSPTCDCSCLGTVDGLRYGR